MAVLSLVNFLFGWVILKDWLILLGSNNSSYLGLTSTCDYRHMPSHLAWNPPISFDKDFTYHFSTLIQCLCLKCHRSPSCSLKEYSTEPSQTILCHNIVAFRSIKHLESTNTIGQASLNHDLSCLTVLHFIPLKSVLHMFFWSVQSRETWRSSHKVLGFGGWRWSLVLPNKGPR